MVGDDVLPGLQVRPCCRRDVALDDGGGWAMNWNVRDAVAVRRFEVAAIT